jgi:hypothetical protein
LASITSILLLRIVQKQQRESIDAKQASAFRTEIPVVARPIRHALFLEFVRYVAEVFQVIDLARMHPNVRDHVVLWKIGRCVVP